MKKKQYKKELENRMNAMNIIKYAIPFIRKAALSITNVKLNGKELSREKTEN